MDLLCLVYETVATEKRSLVGHAGIHFKQANFTTLAVDLRSCTHWFTSVDL